ncbi:hypothetical protein [Lysinibacillus sp. NPDC092081]|uniref:hypothetical protein n=1 Tax=Lysinibacillus sp. NPDC092081 TaxID=3364131 RepID=UPI00382710AA
MNNWKVSTESEHTQRLLELNDFTHNGEIKLIDDMLQVICFDKRVVVVLPKKYHEQLSEMANKQNKTESIMGQKIIQDFLITSKIKTISCQHFNAEHPFIHMKKLLKTCSLFRVNEGVFL